MGFDFLYFVNLTRLLTFRSILNFNFPVYKFVHHYKQQCKQFVKPVPDPPSYSVLKLTAFKLHLTLNYILVSLLKDIHAF